MSVVAVGGPVYSSSFYLPNRRTSPNNIDEWSANTIPGPAWVSYGPIVTPMETLPKSRDIADIVPDQLFMTYSRSLQDN